MPAQNLIKPGAVGAAILQTGDTAWITGDPGNATNASFIIKMVEADFEWWVKTADVMGDGDENYVEEHNSILYGRIAMRGWALANQAIGIANLVSETRNPSGDDDVTPLSVDMFLGSNTAAGDFEHFTFEAMMQRIRNSWHREGVYMGVSLLMHLNNTAASAVQAAIPP